MDSENWKRQIEHIHRLGQVEHLEILLEEINLDKRHIAILQELTKDFQIIVHAPFMDLTLLSPHPEIITTSLEVFKKALSIGENLRAELMTVHAERYPHYWNTTDAQKLVIKALSKLRSNTNLNLSIENLSFSGGTQLAYPSNIAQLVGLVTVLPQKCGITLDTGHLLKDDLNVYDAIEQINSKIYNIHLHDGYKGVAHLQLGKGVLDLKKLIERLIAIDYSQFVTLEVIGQKEINSSWVALTELLH